MPESRARGGRIRQGWKLGQGHDLDNPHRLLQTFQPRPATLDELHSLERPGKARHRLAREDLPGDREAAETCGEVQRPAAITALDRHRLTGGQADPDPERERGLILDAASKTELNLDGGSKRLPRRRENAERFVTAELNDFAAGGGHCFTGESGKSRSKLPGSLVAVCMREARVAADVRDQERADDRPAFGWLRPVEVVGARRCALRVHPGEAYDEGVAASSLWLSASPTECAVAPAPARRFPSASAGRRRAFPRAPAA